MGDYYKTSVTIQEPKYVPPPGGQQQNPTAPVSPATVQRSPVSPSGGTGGGHLVPAEVNPKLKARCGGCEGVLRRLLPVILLFFYSLFGGMLFHLVEVEPSGVEAPSRGLIDERPAYELNLRLTEIVLDRNYTRDRRGREVRSALQWYLDKLDARWRALHGMREPAWDFPGATLYAVSLYTTIGFGNPGPITTTGRTLTIFYALVGIPLAFVALWQLGYLLALGLRRLWGLIRHGRQGGGGGGRWQPVPASDLETRLRHERRDVDTLAFPLTLIIVLFIVWTLITAALFVAWERPRWTYGSAYYFTLTSFATLGLSDLQPWSGWGKLGGSLVLVLGLALLLAVPALIVAQLIALYRCLERAVDAEYSQSLHTDEPMVHTTTTMTSDEAIRRMTARLPFGSRCLYWLLPETAKRALRARYDRRSRLVSTSMQTDDYLWAMSPHGLRTVPERLDDSRSLKSRDDVNSLVMMCDYTLPYKGIRPEY